MSVKFLNVNVMFSQGLNLLSIGGRTSSLTVSITTRPTASHPAVTHLSQRKCAREPEECCASIVIVSRGGERWVNYPLKVASALGEEGQTSHNGAFARPL